MSSRFRRHAIVLIVAAAAFLTPGDIVMSTLALAIPLYLLYELSVLVAYVIWRKRESAAETVAVLLAPLLVAHAWSRRAGAGGGNSRA